MKIKNGLRNILVVSGGAIGVVIFIWRVSAGFTAQAKDVDSLEKDVVELKQQSKVFNEFRSDQRVHNNTMDIFLQIWRPDIYAKAKAAADSIKKNDSVEVDSTR